MCQAMVTCACMRSSQPLCLSHLWAQARRVTQERTKLGSDTSCAHLVDVGLATAHSCSLFRKSSSDSGPWLCHVVALWYARKKRIAATVCSRLACMHKTIVSWMGEPPFHALHKPRKAALRQRMALRCMM